MKKVLIGSSNQSKIEFYKTVLSKQNINVVAPIDLGIKLEIKEDLFDIKGNAIKKARIFAKKAGIPSVSDDTGIFIPALGNEPGVAARKWAGQLPGDISDLDWLKFFYKKIEILDDKQLVCYKHQVISVALPNGDHWETELKRYGKLSKKKKRSGFVTGAPFSAHFYLDEFNKLESDLSSEEMEIYTTKLSNGLRQMFLTLVF